MDRSRRDRQGQALPALFRLPGPAGIAVTVLHGFSHAKPGDRTASAQLLATVRREIQLGTFPLKKHFPDRPPLSSSAKAPDQGSGRIEGMASHKA